MNFYIIFSFSENYQFLQQNVTPGAIVFLWGGGFDLCLGLWIVSKAELFLLQTVPLLYGVIQPIRLNNVDTPFLGKFIFCTWSNYTIQ